MKPRHKSFNAWFDAKLKDYARDIANHGADAGYPHISYNSDCAEIFDAYADEIWDIAVSMADDMDENVGTMIGGFGRADMLDDWGTFKTLMVWFACEGRARELDNDC